MPLNNLAAFLANRLIEVEHARTVMASLRLGAVITEAESRYARYLYYTLV